jgi:hypothetical protein
VAGLRASQEAMYKFHPSPGLPKLNFLSPGPLGKQLVAQGTTLPHPHWEIQVPHDDVPSHLPHPAHLAANAGSQNPETQQETDLIALSPEMFQPFGRAAVRLRPTAETDGTQTLPGGAPGASNAARDWETHENAPHGAPAGVVNGAALAHAPEPPTPGTFHPFATAYAAGLHPAAARDAVRPEGFEMQTSHQAPANDDATRGDERAKPAYPGGRWTGLSVEDEACQSAMLAWQTSPGAATTSRRAFPADAPHQRNAHASGVPALPHGSGVTDQQPSGPLSPDFPTASQGTRLRHDARASSSQGQANALGVKPRDDSAPRHPRVSAAAALVARQREELQQLRKSLTEQRADEGIQASADLTHMLADNQAVGPTNNGALGDDGKSGASTRHTAAQAQANYRPADGDKDTAPQSSSVSGAESHGLFTPLVQAQMTSLTAANIAPAGPPMRPPRSKVLSFSVSLSLHTPLSFAGAPPGSMAKGFH